MKIINYTCAIALLAFTTFFVSSCADDDVPPDVNPEEEITQVLLTFTNVADAGDVVTAGWLDADGEGGDDPEIDAISLDAEKEYTLTIEFRNTLESPPEDITAEIEEEADEHMIFFGFSNGLFSNPEGDGNIDNRNDALIYNDEDSNGLPVGLNTSWTTGSFASGTFMVLLKHQPDIKTATSGSGVGETDVDVEFPISID